MQYGSGVSDPKYPHPEHTGQVTRGRTNSVEERRRAARHVASSAFDPVDCFRLLSMLGLTAAEGLDRVNQNG